ISPAWTQAWIKPYLEIQCGGKTETFALASSIGFSRDYAFEPEHPILLGNNSFKAPFDREFEMECAQKPTEITAGRESSTVETIYQVKQLSAQRLTLAL